jgi:Fe-S-cluster containining protein
MDNHMELLDRSDVFQFACSNKVPCFNACCRDLNQFLTPYDLLRLKKRRQMSSGAFLKQYTTCVSGPETGLPIVSLKPGTAPELRCPFVAPDGCRVYEDRPSSCRTYPLARLARRSRETGQITEEFVLLREPHCRGFEQPHTQTVNQWLADQGVEIYNQYNDLLLEIISLKNRLKPGPLDIRETYAFTLALYDLDHFKAQIKNNNLLNDLDLHPDSIDLALSDDVALLKLGHRWIKKVLFDG